MNLAAPSMCQRIISVVDRAHIPFLPEITRRLSNLKINGDVRRFVITRMGSTGSTWLAKLLNSHPDVHCSHEGFLAQVYPANQSDGGDVLRFIEYFAWDAKHEAYQVVGDIGSLWPCHLAGLPSFTTAILLRHPARILNTRLTVYPTDHSFSEIPPQSRTAILELWGIDLYDYEPIDQIFLHDTFTFAAQIWALDKADLAIRIEDMRGVETCQRILKSLTGLDYSPMLVEQATRTRVNLRTHETRSISEIVAGFTARQRDWYHIMLSDIVPYFGYRLEEFEDGIVPMAGERVSTEMNASPIRPVAGQLERVLKCG